jgi:hypothetical protein
MILKFTLFLLSSIPFCLHAQQLFQDASGETKIFLGTERYGWLFYNTSDKSASIGYNQIGFKSTGYDWKSKEADLIVGGDLKINTKDGLGNVYSKGKVNTGFTLSGNLGFFQDNFLKSGNYLNVYLRPQISYKQYSYVDTVVLDYKLNKENKVEGSVLLNINIQLNRIGSRIKDGIMIKDPKKRNYVFFSFQTGFKQINNYSDLDDGEIITVKSISGAKSIQTTETGKFGNYKRSNTMPLNLDLAFTPRIFKTNYIGFNFYFRTNLFKDANSSNVGFGTYLADPKKPSKISGGIGWQFNDVSDKLKKNNSIFQRSSAFFYVGYSIGPS